MKDIVSQYGVLIVVCIIIALVIAFSTPLANNVIEGIKGMVVGVDDASDNATTTRPYTQLDAPTGLSLDGNLLTFNSVPDATEYRVVISGGKSITTTSTVVDVSELLNTLRGSGYIYVTARGDWTKFKESAAGSYRVINSVALTADSLGVTSRSYAEGNGTAVIRGVNFQYERLCNLGYGMQVKKDSGNVSVIWNTTAFSSPIEKVILEYNSSKSPPDGSGKSKAEIFTFGNSVSSHTYTAYLTTQVDTYTYTVTPDAEKYTYFKFVHDYGTTFYWDSITIILADGTTISG